MRLETIQSLLESSDSQPVTNPAFAIGQRVKVLLTAFTTPRRSRVANYYVTTTGEIMYFLADGGLMSANEIEAE